MRSFISLLLFLPFFVVSQNTDSKDLEQGNFFISHYKRDFLRSALAPASINRVEITEDEARAYAPGHQMSAAVGGSGLNSQLAGQLVGLRVTVIPD